MTPELLEALSDRSMPGRERLLIGDWICRAADGMTSRSNSCTPSGDPAMAFGKATRAVEAWFVERNLQPVFQVWEGSQPSVSEQLDSLGYLKTEGAEVFVLDLTSSKWPSPTAHIELENGLAGLLAYSSDYARLVELDISPLAKAAVTVPDDSGRTGRSSGVAVFDDKAAGLFVMATSPEHRRQGLAASVLSALLDEGVSRGAEIAWLQVMPSNQPAKRLYQGFGFALAHAYHYRVAPAGRSGCITRRK